MRQDSILPVDWPARQRLEALGRSGRVVVFAGIPGVGKSLLVQQLALIARHAGRRVHLLQWDVTRSAFETSESLARYPEVDGFTHPAIKKAVGVWARRGVLAWHEHHRDRGHLLIGEVALVGDRLVELVQPADDDAEALLGGPDTRFLVPVPTRDVRAIIEGARSRTKASPRHEREAADAESNVLHGLWEDVYREGHALGLVPTPPREGPIAYDPAAYAAVYAHWLRHRRFEIVDVDRALPSGGSVYDIDAVESELRARPDEVASIFAELERAPRFDP